MSKENKIHTVEIFAIQVGLQKMIQSVGIYRDDRLRQYNDASPNLIKLLTEIVRQQARLGEMELDLFNVINTVGWRARRK